MTSLYKLSIGVFLMQLDNLLSIFKKTEEHVATGGPSLEELTQSTLIADMKGFIFQVQRMSDFAKFVPVRVAGTESISMNDDEKTWDDCKARLQKTIDFLKTVKPEDMDGNAAKEIVIKIPIGTLTFSAEDYILDFALPNFWFHYTTAYDLLRAKGMPIGKWDYLGKAKLPMTNN